MAVASSPEAPSRWERGKAKGNESQKLSQASRGALASAACSRKLTLKLWRSHSGGHTGARTGKAGVTAAGGRLGWWQMKSFPDKKQLNEFVTTKPVLYEEGKTDNKYDQYNGNKYKPINS